MSEKGVTVHESRLTKIEHVERFYTDAEILELFPEDTGTLVYPLLRRAQAAEAEVQRLQEMMASVLICLLPPPAGSVRSAESLKKAYAMMGELFEEQKKEVAERDAKIAKLRAIVDDLNYIRRSEVSIVVIPNDNPYFGSPAMLIKVCAPWTGDKERTFYGDNLADCLAKAAEAARAAGGE